MAHPITRARALNFNLLNDELALSTMEKKTFDKFLKAYDGDFWQKGQQVLLPTITTTQTVGGMTGTQLLEARYVSRNILLEVVGRVSSAFFGKGPNWNYVVDGRKVNLRKIKKQQAELDKKKKLIERRSAINPDDPIANLPPKKSPPELPPDNDERPEEERVQQIDLPPGVEPEDMPDEEDVQVAAELEEVDKALGEFWTTEGVGERLSDAFDRRLVAGRGGVRIYIPGKYKNRALAKLKSSVPSTTPEASGASAPGSEDGDQAGGGGAQPKTEPSNAPIQFDNIADALKAIRVEYVEPKNAKLLDDEGEMFSIVLYERRDNWDTKETTKVAEFSFVDDEGNTFVGQFTDKEKASGKNAVKGLPLAGSDNMSTALDLDENTTFFEMKGRPFASEQMFQLNQMANIALTCGGFNIVDNGFGELLLTNADMDFEEIPDPTNPNEFRKVAKGLRRGGGIVNSVTGLETTNLETGQEELSTPGVHWREPSSMQSFVDGYYLAYGALLEEACQKFALISGDATVSGESRIQAMSDFYLKIRKYKSEVDKIGSWLMTVVLRLVAALCGKQEDFKDISILYDSRIRIGNLTADERRIVMEMKEKGIISTETARVLLDIEDPDLEEELIDKESEKKMLNQPPQPPAVDEEGNPLPPNKKPPGAPGAPGNAAGEGNSA